jgi:hypothetical protein
MAGGLQSSIQGIVDPSSVPATARISPNLRVKTVLGTIGTIADVVTFPGSPPSFAIVGNWVMGNSRCVVGGIPTTGASSVGLATNPVPAPVGPMRVQLGDPRASGL